MAVQINIENSYSELTKGDKLLEIRFYQSYFPWSVKNPKTLNILGGYLCLELCLLLLALL